jgi:hypothetical protein
MASPIDILRIPISSARRFATTGKIFFSEKIKKKENWKLGKKWNLKKIQNLKKNFKFFFIFFRFFFFFRKSQVVFPLLGGPITASLIGMERRGGSCRTKCSGFARNSFRASCVEQR